MSKPARQAVLSKPQRLPETSPSGIGFVDIRTDERFRWKRMVIRDGSLSSTARLIATLLADEYAGPNSEGIFPTQQTIAEVIGVKDDTVQRALKQLDDAGYILRETQQVSREKRRTSYRLMWKAKADTERNFAPDNTADLRPCNPANDPGATPQKRGIEPYSEPYPDPKGQGDMYEYNLGIVDSACHNSERAHSRGAHQARPDEAFSDDLDPWEYQFFAGLSDLEKERFRRLPDDGRRKLVDEWLERNHPADDEDQSYV